MTQPPTSPGLPQPQAQPVNGLAVGSLVLGILSCVTMCFWFLSVPLGVLAIVLAVLAAGKVKQQQAGGGGMAKAGLILGIIGVALGVIVLIVGMIIHAGAKAGAGFLERKSQELQQRADEIQKQNEAALKKAQEQQQKSTTGPTGSAAPPQGWRQLAQWPGLGGHSMALIVPAAVRTGG